MDDDTTTIAGYPLVRLLRRDGEREVWVADASGAGVEVHRATAGGDAALARQAEALLAAPHPHLLPLLDVATDGGTVLVRPLVQHDLGAWLVQRRAPRPGEAVTALVPVAQALGALHAVGASAGGFAAHEVRLDADGTPLLVADGARVETQRPTDAWRETSEGVAADLASWRALGGALLEDAGGLPAEALAALERQDIAAAGAALLATWPALPLELDAPAPEPAAAPVRLRRRDRPAGLDGALARVALLIERAVEHGGPPAAAIMRALSRVRPAFWAVAGCGAIAVVVAAVLLWPGGAEGAGAAGAPPASPVPPGPAETASPAPAGEASDAPGRAAGELGADADRMDDPVAGTAALLAEREACLDAADAACLATLHEPGSPQLAADEPWRMPADATLEPVQRLGDAWLLRVVSQTAPASVLVMSTEAGWTLRDAWSE